MEKNMKTSNESNFSNRESYTEDIEGSTRNQSLDNTNDILFNKVNDFILNKKFKITKKSQNKNSSNKTFCLKPKIFSEEWDEINRDKWFKNKIKILVHEKNPKKKIFKLYSEDRIKFHSSLLRAEKEKGVYIIRDNNGIIAKIKWNFFSNHFKVFDDKNNLIEEIIYNFNFKGLNGPTKLKILIPKKPNNKNTLTKNINKQTVHKIENKIPEYNDFFNIYVLKFLRRKVIPNEKNFQIINSEFKEDNNNILLQFAKTNKNEYILDYKYPFNNIIAFALGLTSLCSRTFCK